MANLSDAIQGAGAVLNIFAKRGTQSPAPLDVQVVAMATTFDGSDNPTNFDPARAVGAPIAPTSPPATLTASADTPVTFSLQVHHILVQNSSPTAVGVEFDAAASAGSLQVAPNGGSLILDTPVTVLHLYSTAATALNGTAGANIVVKGWV